MKNEEVLDFLEPYPSLRVAMEASTYIAPLHRQLKLKGIDLTVSNPRRTKMSVAQSLRAQARKV